MCECVHEAIYRSAIIANDGNVRALRFSGAISVFSVHSSIVRWIGRLKYIF